MKKQPLDSIFVTDLTGMVAGPACTTILADLGAEVVKVENPAEGDYMRESMRPLLLGTTSYFFYNFNRNKQSITLDMKKEEAREIISKLIKKSDVFIESFRPGVADRLGVGFEDVKKINPRIVYCSISAYGQDGPYSDRPGYDPIIQAESGIMSVVGSPGNPPNLGPPGMVDNIAGVWGALAILSALRERDETGMAQRVDVSLFDVALYLLFPYAIPEYYGKGGDVLPRGSGHPFLIPYEAHKTEDGRLLMVAALSEKLWTALCIALGLENLAKDEKFADNASRMKNRTQLLEVLDKKFAERNLGEWLRILNDAKVPCAPVNTTSKAIQHPQTTARRMLIDIEDSRIGRVKIMGSPVKISGNGTVVRRRAPELGENTFEVLKTLGYGREDCGRLRKEGVV